MDRATLWDDFIFCFRLIISGFFTGVGYALAYMLFKHFGLI